MSKPADYFFHQKLRSFVTSKRLLFDYDDDNDDVVVVVSVAACENRADDGDGGLGVIFVGSLLLLLSKPASPPPLSAYAKCTPEASPTTIPRNLSRRSPQQTAITIFMWRIDVLNCF